MPKTPKFIVLIYENAKNQNPAVYIRHKMKQGQAIILWLRFLSFFLSSFFFPCLISAVADWMSTILLHMVGPSGLVRIENAGLNSELCCTQFAGNAERKKSPKIHHLGTIAQLCLAISSQLRHVLPVEKKQQCLPHMSAVRTIW